MSNTDNCRIKGKCKKEGTEICGPECWKYLLLDYQYSKAGIPKLYEGDLPLQPDDEDYEAFVFLKDYMDNAFMNIKVENKGLFLYSPNKGNGKTSWAIKIMKEYFRQLHRVVENFENQRGLFINVPILFDRLRHNIQNPTIEVQNLEEDIKNADLVVFDDIGTESPSNWVREKLYILISERNMNNKTTIYTSNLSLDELESENFLGERIVDRIHQQSKGGIVEFVGSSKRRSQW